MNTGLEECGAMCAFHKPRGQNLMDVRPLPLFVQTAWEYFRPASDMRGPEFAKPGTRTWALQNLKKKRNFGKLGLRVLLGGTPPNCVSEEYEH